MKQLFSGCKEGFTLFGANVAAIINAVLLSIAYIIGIGITAVFAKIMRKEFLDMRKKKTTYWKNVETKTKSLEDGYRQF